MRPHSRAAIAEASAIIRAAVSVDFFISYNHADRAWAAWIAWQLEDAGYTTIFQTWDFPPGSNFVVEMDRAAQQAKRTLALISPAYIAASFTQAEWAAAFAADPTGGRRKLVPVRVARFDARGILGQVVYIDLVGLDEDEARERLLTALRSERLKPSEAPAFPGTAHAAEGAPSFPGGPERSAGDPAAAATPQETAPPAQTWVKVNEVIFPVDELDDADDAITLNGAIDDEVHRQLDAIRASGFGPVRVRFVSTTRVADADLSHVRRTTRGGRTDTRIELTRATPPPRNATRAGTGGLTPDELVETGMREYFLGEPLPPSMGMLEFMADPGLDRDALAAAFRLPDPMAAEVVRLLVVEGLVGNGHAQAVTHLRIGPREANTRTIDIEWLEPREYVNVEPERRRIHGTWRMG
jgi:hypothetical protein